MKRIKITDDSTKMDRLTEELKKLKGTTMIVGVIGKEGQEDFSLVDLATVHEFGVKIKVTRKMRNWFLAMGYPLRSDTTQIEIPERSFIRTTADEQEDEIQKQGGRLLRKVALGKMDAKTAMDKLGNLVVSMIQNKIKEIEKPPKTQMTIDLSETGGTSPLQDTGRLWQSIDYEVRW